jgi:conjugative transfer signal peptidase TraF
MRARSTDRPRQRIRTLLAVLLGAGGAVATSAAVAPAFSWNLSSSLPRGLYLLERGALPARGSIVSCPPPPGASRLIEARGYLPAGSALLKILVGLPGDFVQVAAAGVFVNGWALGPVPVADRLGRTLEPFPLSRRLREGEAFVATGSPGSFDGRYFGPVPLSTLVVARPLWTY